MKRKFKIILSVFLALLIIAAVGVSLTFLDVAAYTATGTQTLKPSSAGTQEKALVVYDPGLTGAPKDFADKVAVDLQTHGYQVELAGIKSSAATTDSAQYGVIVVGGPVYAGDASASVRSYLSNLKPSSETIIGVFGVGSFNYPNQNVAPLPKGSTLEIRIQEKVNTGENFAQVSNGFVATLMVPNPTPVPAN